MTCEHCGEWLDSQPDGRQNLHRECMIRVVLGSVAHLEKRCSCYVPGAREEGPAGLTLREAALAAVEKALELRLLLAGS